MAEAQNEPTIESRLAFQGKLINVRVDTIRLPQGRTSIREIVERLAAVSVVAITDDRNVLFVRQYRKPIEVYLLEVPAGGVAEGESPEEAAIRELREETGYSARALTHLSSFFTTPGFCTEEMHAYLATGLEHDALQPDFDENIQVVRVPLAQVPAMIASGEIRDAKSIASLLVAMRHL